MATGDLQASAPSIPSPAHQYLEKRSTQNAYNTAVDGPQHDEIDIEHVYVDDDPREWSRRRKAWVLTLVSAPSVVAGFSGNIYNPAIGQVQSDLHTTTGLIALTLSIFTIAQGAAPVIWCAISEITGRKFIYIFSLAICVVASIVAGLAKDVGLFIGMRLLQAIGIASAISIGAATLADIYEPHERGFIMGIYYCAPLVGASMSPLIGGALTTGLGWRATLYFTAIFTGVCAVAFFLFEDTFRRERSAVYVDAVRRRRRERERRERDAGSEASTVAEEGRGKAVQSVPGVEPSKKGQPSSGSVHSLGIQETLRMDSAPSSALGKGDVTRKEILEIRLTLLDVNPVGPLVLVLRRWNNIVIVTASGVFYGFAFSIAYSCSRILASLYGYNALTIGLVLLAFGLGSVCGSLIGGKWSDRVFMKLKMKHGGKSEPEMRLLSARELMIFLPPCVVAYGWVIEEHTNVAAVCVFLFLSGFFSISVYSSTLAYIVDANVGRSASAISLNNFSRGLFAFIAAEIAAPLQDSIGEGGLYSIWAGWLLLSEMLIMLVWWKGGNWRSRGEERDAEDANRDLKA